VPAFTESEIRLDLALPHAFEVRIQTGMGGLIALNQHYFPEKFEEGEADYFRLVVRPEGASEWTGVFYAGYEPGNVVSGVFATADPEQLCVLSRGRAYLVKVSHPREFRVVQECLPVVWAARFEDLLLLADFTHVVAVGREGLVWESSRLTWDGLTDLELQGAMLKGKGWDAIQDKEHPFELDLRTGKHTGGAWHQGAMG
jgi:hypothetical protein